MTIALIRIVGMIKINKHIQETMSRLRLRKKYTCSIVDENKKEIFGMVDKVRNFIAFGKIDEKTLTDLIKARGKKIGNVKAKISETDAARIAKEIMAGKKLEDLGIKPWFGLHPARGGINTKKHFPKGVIGNHGNDINKLIEKML